jgi:hypothetical protein
MRDDRPPVRPRPGPRARPPHRARLIRLGALGVLALAASGCTGEDRPSYPRVEAREEGPSLREGLLLDSVYSVADARSDGSGWWIADRLGRKIHRLDGEARWLGSFGTAGEGPGEFRVLQALLFWGDTLVAFDAGAGGRFKLFLPDGTFVREERLHVEGCLTLLPEVAREIPGEGFLVSAQCVGPPTRGIRSALFLHRPAAEAPALEVAVRERELRDRFNALIRPLAAPAHPGIWFGEMDGPCVTLLAGPLRGEKVNRTRRICPTDWVRVALPAEIRREIEQRTAGSRIVRAIMPIPEFLPAFDRIFFHAEGALLRVLASETVRDLVLLSPDGETRTLLRDLPESTFAEGTRVLSAWDDFEGTRVMLHSLPDGMP